MQRIWTRSASLAPTNLARWRQRAPRYLIGGAWFFIVFTLVHLFWVVGMKWGDPAGLTTLYQTSVMTTAGEETHRAFGLAYDGIPGLLLALVQAGIVVAAAVFSTSTNGRRRRIGHAVLVAWAALWMGDLLHLASIDHALDSIAQATLLTGLFGCTVYRAVAPRRRRGGREGDLVAVLRMDVGPDAGEGENSHADGDADAVSSSAGRARAVGARAVETSRRVVARIRERGAPMASAGAQRLRSGARRFADWLRAKGVFPATTGRTG